MEKVIVTNPRVPVVRLVYEGKDITADVSPLLDSLVYQDHLQGEADSLELTLDDSAGRWRGAWEPEEGARISAELGWPDGPMVPLGTFEIDEIEASGPPAKVVLRCLAAAVRKGLRTSRSRRWEGASLRDVAARVAAEHGLTLQGSVPDLRFKAVMQDRETDLGFLFRLGRDLGLSFGVRGDVLVWTDLEDLRGRPAVITVTPDVLDSWSLSRRVRPGKAEVRQFSAEEKKLIQGAAKLAGAKGGDVVRVSRRMDATRAAIPAATSAAAKRAGAREGRLVMAEGDPRLVAGVSVDLDAAYFGRFSGLYLVTRSEHRVSRSGGWAVELEVNR